MSSRIYYILSSVAHRVAKVVDYWHALFSPFQFELSPFSD